MKIKLIGDYEGEERISVITWVLRAAIEGVQITV
jgi:hypothetical protein